MKNLTKLTIVATSMLIAVGASQAQAQVGLGGGSSIQSDTVVTGETPETLMKKDEMMNDTGLELGTDVEPEAGASVDIDAGTQNDLMFGVIDTDQDGQITEIEFSNSIDADTSVDSFAEFDADSDGMLSETEYQAYLNADAQTDMVE